MNSSLTWRVSTNSSSVCARGGGEHDAVLRRAPTSIWPQLCHMRKYPILVFLCLCFLGMAKPDPSAESACTESVVEIFKKVVLSVVFIGQSWVTVNQPQ
jgi:hypothetical protein